MLLVEDDDLLGEVVAHNVGAAGFEVVLAATSGAAVGHWDRADVVVLDWMLPDEPGLALLRRMRARAHDATPVLMLTARGREADRVEGLEAGADDYLVKPFSAAELVARLRALLRRTTTRRRYVAGSLELDSDRGRAQLAGEELELSRREFELLAYLMAHPGRVFTRQELLDEVWGVDFVGTERTVDQHVAQLRSRVGSGQIATVRGRGYRFEAYDAGNLSGPDEVAMPSGLDDAVMPSGSDGAAKPSVSDGK